MFDSVRKFLSNKMTRNIVLVALVLSLPMTVFVAQQIQENRQRADESPLTPPLLPTPTPSGAMYKISGNVFKDLNGDSTKQSGEGIANVPVKISNENEQLTLELVTDVNGTYQAMLTDAGAYLVAAGSVPGYEYQTSNPKLITVKGACPTVTPWPTNTPTAVPTQEPTATIAPSPTDMPTTIPSNTPFPTVIVDENASPSGDVESASTCSFEFTADFIVKTKLSATTIPTPTINACSVGLTQIGVSTSCGNSLYRYVEFECANGTGGKLGGETSCKTMDSWYGYARNSCLRQSSCPITPTLRLTRTPTPTARPTRTPTPTTRPTATATPIPTATPLPKLACDINSNGKVADEDFYKMVNCYRKNDCSPKDKLRADLNKDGNITFVDLNLFLTQCRSFMTR